MERSSICFPATPAYRELAISMATEAAKLVRGSDSAFVDEVTLAFCAGYDAIAGCRRAGASGLMHLEIEVGADWIRVRLAERAGDVEAGALWFAGADSPHAAPASEPAPAPRPRRAARRRPPGGPALPAPQPTAVEITRRVGQGSASRTIQPSQP